MNRILSSVFVFLLVMALSCTNDPKLIFPSSTQSGKLTGYVMPSASRAHVYLSDSTTFDSTIISSVNGFFSFDSVPFGSYLITISADGYAKFLSHYSLSYPVGYTGYYFLSTTPTQVYSFSPADSTMIDSLYLAQYVATYDSNVMVKITFRESMDTATVANALSISPAIPFTTAWNTSSSYPTLEVFLPIVRLFDSRQRIMTIGSTAATSNGEEMGVAFHYSLFADTSYRQALRLRSFFRSTTPVNGATDLTPPDRIQLAFKIPVDQASVEKAFSMQPSMPVNFFWTPWSDYTDVEILTIQFAAPLQAGMTYNAKLDSGYTSKDRTTSGPEMTLSFSTIPFSIDSYYPLNGAQSVPLDTPFTFTMNFYYDSTTFKRAISFAPAVDSLRFSFSSQFVSIKHAALLPDTTYTMTLDSTLTSTRGTPSGLRKVIQFKTGRQKSVPSIYVSSTPYNSAVNVLPSAALSLRFSDAVNRPSVEQRLHIVPAVAFTSQWNNDSATAITLTPVQPLRTRTVYKVILDSLFLSQNLTPQKQAVTVQFTTQPLAVNKIVPVNDQMSVSTSGRFQLSFSAFPDTATLLSHVHLSPAVDSLAIDSALSAQPVYWLRHAGLSNRTVYTITIDSSATDLYGTASGAQFQSRFTTE